MEPCCLVEAFEGQPSMSFWGRVKSRSEGDPGKQHMFPSGPAETSTASKLVKALLQTGTCSNPLISQVDQ